jgi:hypothetical protein
LSGIFERVFAGKYFDAGLISEASGGVLELFGL